MFSSAEAAPGQRPLYFKYKVCDGEALYAVTAAHGEWKTANRAPGARGCVGSTL